MDGSTSARLLAALRRHYASRPAHLWPVGISKDDAANAVIDLDPLMFERYDGRDPIRGDDVGALLREHGLRAVRVRGASGRTYGYRWSDLRDAWERSLPPVEDECDPDDSPATAPSKLRDSTPLSSARFRGTLRVPVASLCRRCGWSRSSWRSRVRGA